MEIIELENGKKMIPVPENIRYISDWQEFNLDNFGNKPYIIDKQIPGCGFTEYCLTNGDDIILTSPRKMLLDNKLQQHPDDVHYVKNTLEFDPNVDGEGKEQSEEEQKVKDSDTLNAKHRMESKLNEYIDRKWHDEGKPCKIIVTYDSFKHVKEFLKNREILGQFKIVVDEFQSIFIDSRFKATTEYDFFNQLQTLYNNICFVSATPMIDDYLSMIPYFRGMDYYELNWEKYEPSRVMKPELKIRKTKSIIGEIKSIIDKYRKGEFAALRNINNEVVRSQEAVFYLNSVGDIFKVIKKTGLKPEEVNILCSDNPQNRTKLRKSIGEKYMYSLDEKDSRIGYVPLRGEPHKMFTFCTRTVYLGADFYSTNARTFIFSDANIDSLAVDISLDLPQILGRQRLIENPWKNHAEFFFKTFGAGKDVDKEVFNKRISEKEKETISLLNAVENAKSVSEREALIKKYKKDIIFSKYKDDYLSVNTVNGVLTPVFNVLVKISERRAYDIQQVDYKDRFVVFNVIKNGKFNLAKLEKYIDYLRDPKNGQLSERLKDLCENDEFTEDDKALIAHQVSERFDQYYNMVGPKRCAELGYNTTYIRNEIKTLSADQEKLISLIYGAFKVNSRYSNAQAKEMLKKIYEVCGIKQTAKASDLRGYFEVKTIQIYYPDKTKENGLEILGLKK